MARTRHVPKSRDNERAVKSVSSIVKRSFHRHDGKFMKKGARQNFRAATPEDTRLENVIVRDGKILQRQNSDRVLKKDKLIFNLSDGADNELPSNVLAYVANMTAPDSDTESVIEEVQTVTIEDELEEKNELSTIYEVEEGEIVSDATTDDDIQFLGVKITPEKSRNPIPLNQVNPVMPSYVEVKSSEECILISDDEIIEQRKSVSIETVVNYTSGTVQSSENSATISPKASVKVKRKKSTYSYPDSGWSGFDKTRDGLEGTSRQHIEVVDDDINKKMQAKLPQLVKKTPQLLPCQGQNVVIHRRSRIPVRNVSQIPLLKMDDYLDSLSFFIARTNRKHFRGPERICPNFPRQLLDNDPRIFRLICYNILSQEAMDNNRYLYQHLPNFDSRQICDYRFGLLREEIRRLNADLFCLQEVDEPAFHNLYQTLLSPSGYFGFFTKRDEKLDGCAIFWRFTRFELIEQEEINLNFNVNGLDRPNVAQILMVKHIPTGKRIMVVNTHILFNPRRGDIKLNQLAVILAHMKKHQKKVDHVILAGDFNTEPNSPLYKFIRNGSLEINPSAPFFSSTLSGQRNEISGAPLENFTLPSEAKVDHNCVYVPTLKTSRPKPLIKHCFNFANCYDHFTRGGLGEVSTFHADHGNPDHIFYTVNKVVDKNNFTFEVHENGMHLLRRLTLPDLEALKSMSGPLPNAATGSDHIPLLVEFYLY